MARMPHGGRIDRTQPLSFTFNGRHLRGFAGDTLASALLANDVTLVGRSFKYHRPRGVMAAGVEDPSSLVHLGIGAAGEPNARATQVELYADLVATSQNCWPSLRFDLQSGFDAVHRLIPAGFYYKTFIWPRWSLYEGAIRRSAGLGMAQNLRDPDVYTHQYAHCDVLIVGGGPCGLRAAEVAAARGDRVMLVDDQRELGGSLLWRGAGGIAPDLPATIGALATTSNVQILARTTAVGYYDHNLVVLHQRLTNHLGKAAPNGTPRERLWQVRARRVLVATGATERPLVFPDNDRPGVMLADSVLHYLRRYAVIPGRRAVLFANNDPAYQAVFALADAGVEVAGVVDIRASVSDALAAELARRGIRLFSNSAICATHGRQRVRAVRVGAMPSGPTTTLACDLLLVSGGWAPNVHLFSQSGGKLRFDDAQSCFRPAQSAQAVQCIGAANGLFDSAIALREAATTALAPASADLLQWPSAGAGAPGTGDPLAIQPFWRVPRGLGHGRQWVDFHNDVTVDDIALAARENFVSVEHLKRYTGTGMAPDQGKTSNVNALAILALETGRDIAAVGTTTFRPPVVPVTLGAIAGRHIGGLYRARRLLPAHSRHVSMEAMIADYGGWMRPESYPLPGESFEEAVRREGLAVRTRIGLFDASSLGKIEVAGPDAERFLDHVLVTRVEGMTVGQIRYFVMAKEQGIVFDDGVVMRLGADRYWVGASSAHAAHVAQTMDEWLQCEWPTWQVTVTDATRQWATLALAGPESRDVLSTAGTDIDLAAERFPHMCFRKAWLRTCRRGLPA
ncbi:MAG: (2Fe-2S)-binding protein [Betaproteobacteria bacterium]|nr:(2Fe-2S)-binding protein [Betaproteobacteria bacterium]